MKLKEIKPGMAIHCTTREQVKYLVVNDFACYWVLNKSLPIWIGIGDTLPTGDWMPQLGGEKYFKEYGYECIEFSDLIIPELNTEGPNQGLNNVHEEQKRGKTMDNELLEALRTIRDECRRHESCCKGCPLHITDATHCYCGIKRQITPDKWVLTDTYENEVPSMFI